MEYKIYVLKHPNPFVKTRPDVIVYNAPLTDTDRKAIKNLNMFYMKDLGEFGISATIPTGWDEETVYEVCKNAITVNYPMEEGTGFTKERAERLIGAKVTKKTLSPENPSVEPGQTGKVVEARESRLFNGYAVIVDWEIETWIYETPEDFENDVSLIRKVP